MSDAQQKSASTRDGFGRALLEIAQTNSHIVGLCADLTESVRMHWFRDRFPERFVQMGVAEQNLAGVAAGMALTGKIPVAASYAAFHPGNSWGVIRTSICYNNANVKIVGCHSGITTGQDGATHQALEDIALMRVLPNMVVVVPADAQQAGLALKALIKHSGPTYLRTSNYDPGSLPENAPEFKLGKAQRLRTGEDIAFISCGNLVQNCLKAASKLEKLGISAAVINMHTIKPLDVAALKTAARTYKKIITVEEHQIHGGLGSAVAQVLAQLPRTEYKARLEIVGMKDSFGQSGKADELLAEYKLDAESLVARAHA